MKIVIRLSSQRLIIYGLSSYRLAHFSLVFYPDFASVCFSLSFVSFCRLIGFARIQHLVGILQTQLLMIQSQVVSITQLALYVDRYTASSTEEEKKTAAFFSIDRINSYLMRLSLYLTCSLVNVSMLCGSLEHVHQISPNMHVS